ncbi:ferrochelatase [Aridibaculum aurantiacum]|uniref:ferrochelatase n=1 Tax=Aridibaculum aurantiacum TaxID=2810307 RepID=UPI001F60F931|nr:ferrochelatase [Aridibaculum aurantiacum]
MKRGIILMNLGSPDSTEVKDVRKYLMEFLMDARVIDSPFVFRSMLVGGIIVPFRAPKSAEAYKSIWTKDGSPLIVLTKQLQQALQQVVDEPVEIAMRYGNPTMKAAYDNLLKREPGLEEVIAIPMYPHYAMSSYETAVEHAKDVHAKHNYGFKLTVVKPYYNEENYINALAESIRPYLEQDYDQVLFSYHGVPEAHVKSGDITAKHCLKMYACCEVPSAAHKYCYRHHCFTTTKLVAEKLGIPKEKYTYSFQSRLGRAEWLKPYTAVRFEELPKEGVKKLLVACPAFISDCLETLEEIAEEGKETFLHAGGESFQMIPCLNVHPLWVQTLKNYISDIKSGSEKMVLQDTLETKTI